MALLREPRLLDAVRDDRELLRRAIDEVLRWEATDPIFRRLVTQDVELCGVEIPAGAVVEMVLGAANRDPERWDDPDRFDLTRDPSGHVGFGMGIHQCVGQHVARLEAEAVLTALARRVSSVEVAGPTKRHHNNTLRAFESLPLRVRLA